VLEGVDSGVVVDGTVFWSGVVEGVDESGVVEGVVEGVDESGIVLGEVCEGVDESGVVLGVLLGELGVDCEGSVGTTTSPEGLEGVLLGEVGLVVSGVT
jgi:hypothetical protein